MACIYLSPSGQEFNFYLNGGTEEYFTNLIADAMEPYLSSSGICFGRNMPWMTAQQAADNANVFNYNAYLAIHSNSAAENLSGLLRGCDIYYFRDSALSRRYAQITAEYYKTIYPIPSLVNIIPNLTFIELNKTRAPAILVEIGYHDNPEDEAFIKSNTQNIARVLSQATAAFTSTPFVPKPDYIPGLVITDGSGLNIRSEPSSSSAVVSRVPNGTTVRILCKCGLWYRINFGGISGFVSASYVFPLFPERALNQL
ncbi:MAG: SH3 domain-containing protein [Clostridia bacterium]|nr:SH3 domain-containing protein [Clostridia bacterium]